MTPQTIEQFITHYGYGAVFLGTFLEGETVLAVGGILAQRGYLCLPWVMLAAFAGSLAGDLAAYLAGRWRGRSLLAARESWRRRAELVMARLNRHRVAVILLFRFAWGFRNLTPFVLGAGGVPLALFLPLSAVGALAWALGVSAAGYFFGCALTSVLDRIAVYEPWIVLGLTAAAVLGWLAWLAVRASGRRAGGG